MPVHASAVLLAALTASTVGGCGKSGGTWNDAPAPATTPPPRATAVLPPTGQATWHGAPKACAAIKACCATSSDVSLFCALTEGGPDVEGDCGRGLPRIRTYVTQAHQRPPAGCM